MSVTPVRLSATNAASVLPTLPDGGTGPGHRWERESPSLHGPKIHGVDVVGQHRLEASTIEPGKDLLGGLVGSKVGVVESQVLVP